MRVFINSRLVKCLILLFIVVFVFNDSAQGARETFYSIRKTKKPVKETQGPKDAIPSSLGTIEALTLPEAYGTIREIFTGKSDKTLIHIQDVHASYEVQTNISKLINHINTHFFEGDLSVVGVEGARGEVDLSLLQSIRDPEIKKKVADLFIQQGYLTGPESFAVLQNSGAEIYGVEEGPLYFENLDYFQEATQFRADILPLLNQLKEGLTRLEETLFTQELKEFAQMSEDYEQDKIVLSDYIVRLNSLCEQKNISLDPFPDFAAVIKVTSIENSLNFSEYESERKQFMRALQKEMSEENKKEFLAASLKYRTGQMTSLEYFDWLHNSSQKLGFQWKKSYPNMALYHQLIKVQSQIKTEKLFEQLDEVEGLARKTLFVHPDQERLAQIIHRVNILMRLSKLEMTRKDMRIYSENKDSFKLKRSIPWLKRQFKKYSIDIELPKDIKVVSKFLHFSEKFYHAALKRDDVIVQNMLSAMDKNKTEKAVLVSGGFHTDGILKQLKSKQISYAVVMPRLTSEYDEGLYINLMMNELDSVERGFEETQTLAPLIRQVNEITQGLSAAQRQRVESLFERNLQITTATIIGFLFEKEGAALANALGEGRLRTFGIRDLERAVSAVKEGLPETLSVEIDFDQISGKGDVVQIPVTFNEQTFYVTFDLSPNTDSPVSTVTVKAPKTKFSSESLADLVQGLRKQERGEVAEGEEALSFKTVKRVSLLNQASEAGVFGERVKKRFVDSFGNGVTTAIEKELSQRDVFLEDGSSVVEDIPKGSEIEAEFKIVQTEDIGFSIEGNQPITFLTVLEKRTNAQGEVQYVSVVYLTQGFLEKVEASQNTFPLIAGLAEEFLEIFQGITHAEASTKGQLAFSSPLSRSRGVSDLKQFGIDQAAEQGDFDYLLSLLDYHPNDSDNAFRIAALKAIVGSTAFEKGSSLEKKLNQKLRTIEVDSGDGTIEIDLEEVQASNARFRSIVSLTIKASEVAKIDKETADELPDLHRALSGLGVRGSKPFLKEITLALFSPNKEERLAATDYVYALSEVARSYPGEVIDLIEDIVKTRVEFEAGTLKGEGVFSEGAIGQALAVLLKSSQSTLDLRVNDLYYQENLSRVLNEILVDAFYTSYWDKKPFDADRFINRLLNQELEKDIITGDGLNAAATLVEKTLEKEQAGQEARPIEGREFNDKVKSKVVKALFLNSPVSLEQERSGQVGRKTAAEILVGALKAKSIDFTVEEAAELIFEEYKQAYRAIASYTVREELLKEISLVYIRSKLEAAVRGEYEGRLLELSKEVAFNLPSEEKPSDYQAYNAAMLKTILNTQYRGQSNRERLVNEFSEAYKSSTYSGNNIPALVKRYEELDRLNVFQGSEGAILALIEENQVPIRIRDTNDFGRLGNFEDEVLDSISQLIQQEGSTVAGFRKVAERYGLNQDQKSKFIQRFYKERLLDFLAQRIQVDKQVLTKEDLNALTLFINSDDLLDEWYSVIDLETLIKISPELFEELVEARIEKDLDSRFKGGKGLLSASKKVRGYITMAERYKVSPQRAEKMSQKFFKQNKQAIETQIQEQIVRTLVEDSRGRMVDEQYPVAQFLFSDQIELLRVLLANGYISQLSPTLQAKLGVLIATHFVPKKDRATSKEDPQSIRAQIKENALSYLKELLASNPSLSKTELVEILGLESVRGVAGALSYESLLSDLIQLAIPEEERNAFLNAALLTTFEPVEKLRIYNNLANRYGFGDLTVLTSSDIALIVAAYNSLSDGLERRTAATLLEALYDNYFNSAIKGTFTGSLREIFGDELVDTFSSVTKEEILNNFNPGEAINAKIKQADSSKLVQLDKQLQYFIGQSGIFNAEDKINIYGRLLSESEALSAKLPLTYSLVSDLKVEVYAELKSRFQQTSSSKERNRLFSLLRSLNLLQDLLVEETQDFLEASIEGYDSRYVGLIRLFQVAGTEGIDEQAVIDHSNRLIDLVEGSSLSRDVIKDKTEWLETVRNYVSRSVEIRNQERLGEQNKADFNALKDGTISAERLKTIKSSESFRIFFGEKIDDEILTKEFVEAYPEGIRLIVRSGFLYFGLRRDLSKILNELEKPVPNLQALSFELNWETIESEQEQIDLAVAALFELSDKGAAYLAVLKDSQVPIDEIVSQGREEFVDQLLGNISKVYLGLPAKQVTSESFVADKERLDKKFNEILANLRLIGFLQSNKESLQLKLKDLIDQVEAKVVASKSTPELQSRYLQVKATLIAPYLEVGGTSVDAVAGVLDIANLTEADLTADKLEALRQLYERGSSREQQKIEIFLARVASSGPLDDAVLAQAEALANQIGSRVAQTQILIARIERGEEVVLLTKKPRDITEDDFSLLQKLFIDTETPALTREKATTKLIEIAQSSAFNTGHDQAQALLEQADVEFETEFRVVATSTNVRSLAEILSSVENETIADAAKGRGYKLTSQDIKDLYLLLAPGKQVPIEVSIALRSFTAGIILIAKIEKYEDSLFDEGGLALAGQVLTRVKVASGRGGITQKAAGTDDLVVAGSADLAIDEQGLILDEIGQRESTNLSQEELLKLLSGFPSAERAPSLSYKEYEEGYQKAIQALREGLSVSIHPNAAWKIASQLGLDPPTADKPLQAKVQVRVSETPNIAFARQGIYEGQRPIGIFTSFEQDGETGELVAVLHVPRGRLDQASNQVIGIGLIHEALEVFGGLEHGVVASEVELALSSQEGKDKGVSDRHLFDLEHAVQDQDVDYLKARLLDFHSRDVENKFRTAAANAFLRAAGLEAFNEAIRELEQKGAEAIESAQSFQRFVAQLKQVSEVLESLLSETNQIIETVSNDPLVGFLLFEGAGLNEIQTQTFNQELIESFEAEATKELLSRVELNGKPLFLVLSELEPDNATANKALLSNLFAQIVTEAQRQGSLANGTIELSNLALGPFSTQRDSAEEARVVLASTTANTTNALKRSFEALSAAESIKAEAVVELGRKYVIRVDPTELEGDEESLDALAEQLNKLDRNIFEIEFYSYSAPEKVSAFQQEFQAKGVDGIQVSGDKEWEEKKLENNQRPLTLVRQDDRGKITDAIQKSSFHLPINSLKKHTNLEEVFVLATSLVVSLDEKSPVFTPQTKRLIRLFLGEETNILNDQQVQAFLSNPLAFPDILFAPIAEQRPDINAIDRARRALSIAA